MGHTTWDPLECMTRIWKNYVFTFGLTDSVEDQAARSNALGGKESKRRQQCAERAATMNVQNHAFEENPSPTTTSSSSSSASACNSKSTTSSLTTMPSYSHEDIAAAAALGAIVPGSEMIFSSFPAVLYSFDDWYQLQPSTLIVTETTIINNNFSLYTEYLSTNGTVMTFARNMAANRIANSGKEWMDTYGRYISGTYNNEYLVLDTKKFANQVQPVTSLPDGLLYVGEQFPGYWMSEDRTSWLEHSGNPSPGPGQGYVASYNRPSFPFMFNISNQWALVDTYGSHFLYNNTARANIFRRGQGTVTDVNSLYALLRYNDFTQDPLSTQGCNASSYSASNAIAERGDLTPAAASCCAACGLTRLDEGAIDVKIASVSMMTNGNFQSLVESGPTTNFGKLPVFVWSSSPFAQTVAHEGQPDVWNFSALDVSY